MSLGQNTYDTAPTVETMAPTRRDALRTAALLCGLGSLAGCVTQNFTSSNGASQGDGRPTTGTTSETGPTTRTATETEPSTVEQTPTERTATERPPTESTRPEETTMPEATVPEGSTATTTGATPDHKTSPESIVTPPSDERVRSVGDVRVAVTNLIARKVIAYDSLLGSGGVLARPDRQFVVATVRSASGSEFDAAGPPEYDAFSLVADSETFPAVTVEERTAGGTTASLAGRGDRGYGTIDTGGWPTGWIAFEPPSPLETGNAAIRCQHGNETATWSLPDSVVETLARTGPSFELQSFSAERNGPEVELSLVATNVADVDGEFLAAVYWPTTAIADDDESIIVRREVAAGDRVEWSKTVSTGATGGGEDGTVTARVDGVVTGEAAVAVPRTTV
jgi:hypothetical protein